MKNADILSDIVNSALNPSLHWLFLDHDIIFYFLDNIEK